MRFFNHIIPATAMPAPPKSAGMPKSVAPGKQSAPPKPKPQFAKFRIEDLELWREFKLAATVRNITLIKAFSRAMKLFIDELTVDLDAAVARSQEPGEAPAQENAK